MVPDRLLKEIEVKTTAGRIWLGLPPWMMLLWAALISWQVWDIADRMDHFEESRVTLARDYNESLAELSQAVGELRDDSIRIRAVLRIKFPKTSQEVEDALEPAGDFR